MNALQQFLQSASNEAAGAVSGPVDLIGMGLRKLGVPVPRNALMSSEWMRQNGLMQDVPQNAASLAGQTFGLLSPVVAAAKAPQIARGLLSLDDKAMDMTRRGVESYMDKAGLRQNAIVYHGSPHKFDKFDSSKIGTGEGAQAYGHGLYLAEGEDVAKSYMRPAGRTPSEIDGRNVIDAAYADRSLERAARYLQDYGTPEEAIKWSASHGDGATSELLRNLVASGRLKKAPDGEFYKVDLPDEKIARMLDWDGVLGNSKAAEVVAPVYQARLRELSSGSDVPLDVALSMARNMTGQKAYSLLGGNRKAEDALRAAGIPGIRYLDGGSRSAGAGSSNFVVFPGEENALRILERNGKPIR